MQKKDSDQGHQIYHLPVREPVALDRFDYLPITDRPKIIWPGGARLALWVAPNVEHYEYMPSPENIRSTQSDTDHPDVRSYANSDYGNRVGFWRLLETLDRFGIRCTASLNVAVLDHFPEIKEAMVERNWDFMSHGIYNNRLLYGLTEEQEKEFYQTTKEAVKQHTGKELKGMLGPAYSHTKNTPDLMAEAGFVYHADWLHDDQPFPLRTRSRNRFISMPYSVQINDGSMAQLHFDAQYFAQIIKDQFDVLYEEGQQSGRVMCIALHPHWSGRPDRRRYLDDAFEHILSHDKVWQATADEIAEYYLEHHYDQVKSCTEEYRMSL